MNHPSNELGHPYVCHCCASKNTLFVQHYILRRSMAVAPLYLCIACGSISVNHAVVRRHFPRASSEKALRFHRSIVERNRKWSNILFDKINAQVKGKSIDTVIDIGCGIGTLLGVAADRGMNAIGYELEPLVLAEARLDRRLTVHGTPFGRDAKAKGNTLVCCIAVLEHLDKPLALINDIACFCRASNASAFLFVPKLPKNWSSYLSQSALAKGNPFFDNEQHVTHFTPECFAKACANSFGSPLVELAAGAWAGLFHGTL